MQVASRIDVQVQRSTVVIVERRDVVRVLLFGVIYRLVGALVVGGGWDAVAEELLAGDAGGARAENGSLLHPLVPIPGQSVLS